jgi:amino acid permease
MPAVESANEHFSTTVGLLYVFNLIVGTGALALPSAFQNAGYILGTALLLVSAFTSYICATFVVECMGIANAVIRRTRKKSASFTDNMDSLNSELTEGNRIQNQCEITTRVEVSEMSHIFLGRPGIIFTYLVLTVYLFGDLAIYSTTVPKSLMNVVCESINVSTVTRELPCHSHWPEFFSRHNVYRMCIVAFVSFCLPMVYVGMTKTKWIQLFTTASRWTAFLLMIVMALIQLGDSGAQASPPAANFHGFGSLFGVAVYAFMCHHSIPGLVTPVRDKSFFNYKLTSVYAVIFLFYCTLSITGSFAFNRYILSSPS